MCVGCHPRAVGSLHDRSAINIKQAEGLLQPPSPRKLVSGTRHPPHPPSPQAGPPHATLLALRYHPSASRRPPPPPPPLSSPQRIQEQPPHHVRIVIPQQVRGVITPPQHHVHDADTRAGRQRAARGRRCRRQRGRNHRVPVGGHRHERRRRPSGPPGGPRRGHHLWEACVVGREGEVARQGHRPGPWHLSRGNSKVPCKGGAQAVANHRRVVGGHGREAAAAEAPRRLGGDQLRDAARRRGQPRPVAHDPRGDQRCRHVGGGVAPQRAHRLKGEGVGDVKPGVDGACGEAQVSRGRHVQAWQAGRKRQQHPHGGPVVVCGVPVVVVVVIVDPAAVSWVTRRRRAAPTVAAAKQPRQDGQVHRRGGV